MIVASYQLPTTQVKVPRSIRLVAIMLLQSVLSIALAVFSTCATAAPTEVSTKLGSKHNLYLVTCKRRSGWPDCPLIILCSRQESEYTAVAYYANGPVESNRNSNPTQISTVSEPAQPWEGGQRVAKLGRVGEFSSAIDADGAALEKGEIAGSAKLDDEDFVCFSDGETSIAVRDGLGDIEYTCSADYWCPSIQV